MSQILGYIQWYPHICGLDQSGNKSQMMLLASPDISNQVGETLLYLTTKSIQ